MRWLGPMLHMLYPPRPDPVTLELVALLDQQQVSGAELSAARRQLERIAADRGAAIDDVAGERS